MRALCIVANGISNRITPSLSLSLSDFLVTLHFESIIAVLFTQNTLANRSMFSLQASEQAIELIFQCK